MFGKWFKKNKQHKADGVSNDFDFDNEIPHSMVVEPEKPSVYDLSKFVAEVKKSGRKTVVDPIVSATFDPLAINNSRVYIGTKYAKRFKQYRYVKIMYSPDSHVAGFVFTPNKLVGSVKVSPAGSGYSFNLSTLIRLIEQSGKRVPYTDYRKPTKFLLEANGKSDEFYMMLDQPITKKVHANA